MNGAEQQTAGRRYAELSRQIEDASTVIEELDGRQVELAGIVKTIDERLVGIGEGAKAAFDALEDKVEHLRERVDWLQREVAGKVGQLQHTGLAATPVLRAATLGQRLRWLATGEPT